VAEKANERYQTPEGRQGLVQSLSAKKREERTKPLELISKLGIQPGQTIADIGTGPGMMLPYLSEAVGPGGKVIAEDIQQDFLDRAEERAKSRNLANVTFVKGTDRNPNLPEGQLDLAFILDAYHHFDYPGEMLGHIAKALKPDGRLAVVEIYRHRRDQDGKDNKDHVRADKDEIIREIESNGWRLVSQQDHVDNQYLLILVRK
jgi:ubiquinone/menaquinone biosynthesis C-methylase UbiE